LNPEEPYQRAYAAGNLDVSGFDFPYEEPENALRLQGWERVGWETVGERQWVGDSGRETVGEGQWERDSGRKTVGEGQWEKDSERDSGRESARVGARGSETERIRESG